MIVGFTGTRKGMSESQLQQFRYVIALFKHADQLIDRSPEFHHGGADGADAQAVRLARSAGFLVYVHPCVGVVRNPQDPYLNDCWLEVFAPLVRNRHIVEESHVLIAAPETDVEKVRSGTWATIRYARQKGIPVVMLSRGRN